MDYLLTIILIILIYLIIKGTIELDNAHDYSGDLKKDRESNSLKEFFKDFY